MRKENARDDDDDDDDDYNVDWMVLKRRPIEKSATFCLPAKCPNKNDITPLIRPTSSLIVCDEIKKGNRRC